MRLSTAPLAALLCGITFLSTYSLAQPTPQAVIHQSLGSDPALDYASLTRFGPWDDRNYLLTSEDLELLAPEEHRLTDRIPAFYRVILRKRFPNLQRTGPSQYPRSASQVYRLLYGGPLVNGRFTRGDPTSARSVSPDPGEITLSQITGRDEVTIEINSSDPRQVIAGANSEFFGQEMYYSTDAGRTWMLSATSPLPQSCCDPTVAWSSDGLVAYAATLTTSFGIETYRSTDGGANWGGVVTITETGSDKEFIHVDSFDGIDAIPASPFLDNLYITYHDGNVMQFSRSTDRGASFAPPTAFGIPAPLGIGSDITTDAQGNIYYVYASLTGSFTGPAFIALVRSTDGGVTFEPATVLAATAAQFIFQIPSFLTRQAFIYPAADTDLSGGDFHNRIYVAWNDLTGPESAIPTDNHPIIRVAYSSDAGANWTITTPHPTTDTLVVDRFHPWISVDQSDGEVHVIYYDTQQSIGRAGVDIYHASSIDGGASWQTPTRVTSETSDIIDNFQQWGDYNGLSVVGDMLMTSWTDNRDEEDDTRSDAFAARFRSEGTGPGSGAEVEWRDER